MGRRAISSRTGLPTRSGWFKIPQVQHGIHPIIDERIMRRDNQRRPDPLGIADQQIRHQLRIHGVQRTGRLVRQDDRRLTGQRPRDPDPPDLAAGELARQRPSRSPSPTCSSAAFARANAAARGRPRN